MMEKEQLRKADIFSGSIIFLLGCFIISEALKMPMKDSWGGVQNVWYVSPAIFPLFIGAMISLLGALLIRTAFKTAGMKGLKQVKSYLLSNEFKQFLKIDENIRFYAILVMLTSFVYLYLPRVDFFLAAIQFLFIFVTMFYWEEIVLLKKLFTLYLIFSLAFILVMVSGLDEQLSSFIDYPLDGLVLLCIPGLLGYGFFLSRQTPDLFRKFKISFTISILAPLVIGIIFKYLLLVPMPFEGMVIELIDIIWYMDF
jgi:hypothetical protein